MAATSETKPKVCRRCGEPLAGAELSGNCPRCLAALLLSPDTPEPVESSPATILRRLGDYELLEEVARGGMGVVFRARQVSLGREVAVKVLRDAWLATPVQVKRFQAEAANAAKLKHPNIVAVHEVGEQGGQHFFAMDLIKGRNLADATREGPLPPRRAAELVRKVAEAVQHAHQQGVLHRDIKPSNVLLDAQDEPHVTDFGLARPMDDESSLTLTGQVLGTPGYMAPEQAKGGGTVGPAADVYGLGALLFHLLTGRAPFVGASAAETLTQVLQQEPLSPRLLNPTAPVDLAVVCLKCLRKAPRERYASAGELAADLGRFLGNQTTHARPEGPLDRSVRWCRRKPALAATMVALLLVSLAGLAGVVWQWQRARVAADHARLNAYEADMNLAQQALNVSNRGRAQELLKRYRPGSGNKDLRGWEWRYLWARSRSDERATIASLPGGITALAFTPDHNILAGAEGSGKVRFWNSKSWQEIEQLEVGAAIRSMALSPDGQLVALGTLDNQVTVWNWRQKHQTARFGMAHGGYIGDQLVFSPDGSCLITGDEHGSIEVRSTEDFRQVRTWAAHKKGIRALAFSRDGRLLASGGDDESVQIWDTVTWKQWRAIPAPVHQTAVLGIRFSADGKSLLTCGIDPLIKSWDLSTGRQTTTFTGHTAHVFAAVFSPDGHLVVSASGDQTIRVWKSGTQQLIAKLQGHEDEVGLLALGPDGKMLVSGAKDGMIKLWDVPQQHDDPTFVPAAAGVFAGELSRDGRILVSYSPEGIEAWDAQERKQLGLISFAAGQELFAGPFAVNGGALAFRWVGGTVRVFSLMPFQESAVLPYPAAGSNRTNSELARLALSDDGKLLAAVSVAGEAEVQDWSTRRSIARWAMRAGPSSLMFTPDGRFLASGHVDGTVELWHAEGGTHLATLKAHQARADALAFSPDGRLLATGGRDSLVKVWDRSSQRLLATLNLRRFSVDRLAFTPDGTRLAAANGDGSITFWNLDTYQEVLTVNAHSSQIWLAFVPDGKTLVSGSPDGVRYWRAPSLEEIETAAAAPDHR